MKVQVTKMASLNDIESQLDTVIENLTGGISNSVIYDVIVDEGAYTLTNDKTFTDIRTDITNGKMPIIRYSDTVVYFFMPSITATAETDTLAWYFIRPIIDGGAISARIILVMENTETTNKFTTQTITISD